MNEPKKFRHGSLFSGIGGFDLAAEWMDWENVFHCEWNPFGQRVLKHYWPNAESFDDITKTDFSKYYGAIDLISGGFPCQPYSMAGKRLGNEDERHLWPHMLRAIGEIAPSWVVGENVRGLTNWNGGMVFDQVCVDLENLGYSVAAFLIPACATNAPHKRERIWIVANANKPRLERCANNEGVEKFRTKSKQQFAGPVPSTWKNFTIESAICGRNDGFSAELDGITFSKWRIESIKAFGNAVCPNVVLQIFKTIEMYEQQQQTQRP